MAGSNFSAYSVFAFGFLAVGLAILGAGVWTAIQCCRSGTWPTTPGQVSACKVMEVRGSKGKGRRYRVDVSYAYTVDGQHHVGDTLAIGYKAGVSESESTAIAHKLQQAEKVAVRYHPVDATRSVLTHGLHRSLFVQIWFGLILSGIAAVLIKGDNWQGQRRQAQLLVGSFVVGMVVYIYLMNRNDPTLLNNIEVL